MRCEQCLKELPSGFDLSVGVLGLCGPECFPRYDARCTLKGWCRTGTYTTHKTLRATYRSDKGVTRVAVLVDPELYTEQVRAMLSL